YPCEIATDTTMARCYGTTQLTERHRHRYEFNNDYRKTLTDAGLHGIENRLPLPKSADVNLYTADAETLRQYQRIPATLHEAEAAAKSSDFIQSHLPELILRAYTER
ncbi:MAG: hypothetical protein IJV64_01150, partial [Oscillospiraceae bacterium]|nr:hypothetical protein [Oscillospiraceae bacterium]